MSGYITLQRGKTSNAIETQAIELAVDAGAFREGGMRVRIDSTSGTGSGKTVFELQHAADPNTGEFLKLAELNIVTADAKPGSAHFVYFTQFTRYLRWSLTDLGGFDGVSFRIDLVMKS